MNNETLKISEPMAENPLLSAGWISANERPPSYRTVLLCFEKEYPNWQNIMKTGYWCGDCYFADGGHPLLTKNVIYWMELPRPPACR